MHLILLRDNHGMKRNTSLSVSVPKLKGHNAINLIQASITQAFSAVEMLWLQAVSLITIAYSFKSSGKFLASLNLSDVDTREISRSVMYLI